MAGTVLGTWTKQSSNTGFQIIPPKQCIDGVKLSLLIPDKRNRILTIH